MIGRFQKISRFTADRRRLGEIVMGQRAGGAGGGLLAGALEGVQRIVIDAGILVAQAAHACVVEAG